MSDHTRTENGPLDTAGTVVLGFGPQPMDWFHNAMKSCGSDAVTDPDVARMAGATLAAGTPAALRALRKHLEAGALQQAQEANPGIPPSATRWLAHGERGMSSNAMFEHLTGVKCTNSDGWPLAAKAHPRDPADFRRCRLLPEEVPSLQAQLPKMAELSKPWANLVRDWTAICRAMDGEAPDWRDRQTHWSCPKTYEMIKNATKD